MRAMLPPVTIASWAGAGGDTLSDLCDSSRHSQKERVGETDLLLMGAGQPPELLATGKSRQRSITLSVFRFQLLFDRKENAFERGSSFIYRHLAHDASF